MARPDFLSSGRVRFRLSNYSYAIYVHLTLNTVPFTATYEGNTVAIKINTNETVFTEELKGFEALNATVDEDIESHGIPKIYFSGKFLRKYHAIAMTLLDGTLQDRMRKQKKEKKKISELSLLLIFRRAVRDCCRLYSRIFHYSEHFF